MRLATTKLKKLHFVISRLVIGPRRVSSAAGSVSAAAIAAGGVAVRFRRFANNFLAGDTSIGAPVGSSALNSLTGGVSESESDLNSNFDFGGPPDDDDDDDPDDDDDEDESLT